MEARKEQNKELGKFGQWNIPKWEDLEVYNGG
jgi:hypothetical protein